MKNKTNQKGFTLIELLVVMVVFTIIIVITAGAFKTILTQSAKLLRSEESNIEGVIGLEMLRHDLQQSGYGLFTETMANPYAGEATIAPPSNFNEASLTSPPRALVTGNNLAAVTDNSSVAGNTFSLLAGTDYIAIKGMPVGRSKASRRWTYLQRDASGAVVPASWASSAENFATNEKVMFLRRKFSTGSSTLAVEREPSTGDFYFPFSNVAFVGYSNNYNDYVVYGLDDAASLPRMPFNRSDYFVARPSAAGSVPGFCAPNTGILYKTIVNNSTAGSGGRLSYMPVLDCVADMQVVLMWDLMDSAAAGMDGSVDTYTSADGSVKSGPGDTTDVIRALTTPAVALTTGEDPANYIRTRLKGIKIYVLAQNGRLDPGYTSPSPITYSTTEASLTRPAGFNINAQNWQHYRWKLYQMVVRPKNLTANQ
jgi:prepilin-type N-terminal cleavage/methylation domain-containing protein